MKKYINKSNNNDDDDRYSDDDDDDLQSKDEADNPKDKEGLV